MSVRCFYLPLHLNCSLYDYAPGNICYVLGSMLTTNPRIMLHCREQAAKQTKWRNAFTVKVSAGAGFDCHEHCRCLPRTKQHLSGY